MTFVTTNNSVTFDLNSKREYSRCRCQNKLHSTGKGHGATPDIGLVGDSRQTDRQTDPEAMVLQPGLARNRRIILYIL